MPSTLQGAAEYLVQRLKAEGFKVQRYDAYSTQSVYLKLDYGVGNSIRISDHLGKRHLAYRYNLVEGMGTIHVAPRPGKYPRYFYSFAKMGDMVADILAARTAKLDILGPERYVALMETSRIKNRESRGFWTKCAEV